MGQCQSSSSVVVTGNTDDVVDATDGYESTKQSKSQMSGHSSSLSPASSRLLKKQSSLFTQADEGDRKEALYPVQQLAMNRVLGREGSGSFCYDDDCSSSYSSCLLNLTIDDTSYSRAASETFISTPRASNRQRPLGILDLDIECKGYFKRDSDCSQDTSGTSDTMPETPNSFLLFSPSRDEDEEEEEDTHDDDDILMISTNGCKREREANSSAPLVPFNSKELAHLAPPPLFVDEDCDERVDKLLETGVHQYEEKGVSLICLTPPMRTSPSTSEDDQNQNADSVMHPSGSLEDHGLDCAHGLSDHQRLMQIGLSLPLTSPLTQQSVLQERAAKLVELRSPKLSIGAAQEEDALNSDNLSAAETEEMDAAVGQKGVTEGKVEVETDSITVKADESGTNLSLNTNSCADQKEDQSSRKYSVPDLDLPKISLESFSLTHVPSEFSDGSSLCPKSASLPTMHTVSDLVLSPVPLLDNYGFMTPNLSENLSSIPRFVTSFSGAARSTPKEISMNNTEAEGNLPRITPSPWDRSSLTRLTRLQLLRQELSDRSISSNVDQDSICSSSSVRSSSMLNQGVHSSEHKLPTPLSPLDMVIEDFNNGDQCEDHSNRSSACAKEIFFSFESPLKEESSEVTRCVSPLKEDAFEPTKRPPQVLHRGLTLPLRFPQLRHTDANAIPLFPPLVSPSSAESVSILSMGSPLSTPASLTVRDTMSSPSFLASLTEKSLEGVLSPVYVKQPPNSPPTTSDNITNGRFMADWNMATSLFPSSMNIPSLNVKIPNGKTPERRRNARHWKSPMETAVEPGVVTHFNQLQVEIARAAYERKMKRMFMKRADRHRDMKQYHQLLREFEIIKLEAKKLEKRKAAKRRRAEEKAERRAAFAADSSAVVDSKVQEVTTKPKRLSAFKPKTKTPAINDEHFALKDTVSWYVNFKAFVETDQEKDQDKDEEFYSLLGPAKDDTLVQAKKHKYLFHTTTEPVPATLGGQLKVSKSKKSGKRKQPNLRERLMASVRKSISLKEINGSGNESDGKENRDKPRLVLPFSSRHKGQKTKVMLTDRSYVQPLQTIGEGESVYKDLDGNGGADANLLVNRHENTTFHTDASLQTTIASTSLAAQQARILQDKSDSEDSQSDSSRHDDNDEEANESDSDDDSTGSETKMSPVNLTEIDEDDLACKYEELADDLDNNGDRGSDAVKC